MSLLKLPKFEVPKWQPPKFKVAWKLGKLKKLNKAQVGIGIVVVLALYMSFLFLMLRNSNQYPQVSKEEFVELDKQLESALSNSKKNPQEAIKLLLSMGPLPKILDNRRNFVLGDLYEKIDETALSFINFYNLDKNYLPKYAQARLVKIAEKIGFESIVVEISDYLIDKYPHEPQFLYDLAKSYLRQSLFDKAKETFVLVQKLFPNTDFAAGSDYYLANLISSQDENKAEKVERLYNYLKNNPGGNFATLIADQINSLNEEDQKKFADLNNQIALSYFLKKEYEKALNFFTVDESSNKLILEHAQTLVELKRQAEAVNLLMTEIPKTTDEETAKKALEYLISLSNKQTVLSQLQTLYPQAQIIKDKILWHIAERTDLKEDYRKIYEEFPDSFYAPESMARVFWQEYKRGADHVALRIYQQHWSMYPHAKSHSMVAFWAAKIYFQQSNPEMARATLQNIIDTHPKDYYRFRAEDVLDDKKHWHLLSGANEFVTLPSWTWPRPFSEEEIKNKYGPEAFELIKVHQYNLVQEQLNQDDISDTALKAWLYAMSGDNLKAISTAYTALPEDTDIQYDNILFQYSYPLNYADLVADEISQRQKIDPMLVQALIKQESFYQPEIVSKAGAIGLMQLMPYTARDVARTLGDKAPSIDDLMEPGTNIRLGVKYMEEVFEKFDNNMIFAIASYNAGPLAVRRWIKKSVREEDPDLFIENIPYSETKGYVKKVLTNFWIYKRLYS